MKRAFPMLLFAGALLAGCGPSAPAQAPRVDPSGETWYSQTTERLANMDRAAEQLLQSISARFSTAQVVET
jgi:hypothetical protein